MENKNTNRKRRRAIPVAVVHIGVFFLRPRRKLEGQKEEPKEQTKEQTQKPKSPEDNDKL